MMNEDFRNNSIDPELQVRLLNLVMGEASDFERDQLQAMMEQRPELAVYFQHLQHLHGLLQEVGSGEFPLKSDFAPKSDSELESDSEADTDADSSADSGSIPWKMSTERREKLLAVLQGDATGSFDSASNNASSNATDSVSQAEETRQQPIVGSASVQRKITWWRKSPRRLAELAAVSACLLLGLFLILPSMQSARDAARAIGISRKFSGSQYGLASEEFGERNYTVVVPPTASSSEPATYFLKDDVKFQGGTNRTFTVPVAPSGTKEVTVLPSKPTQQLDALRASTSGELFGNSLLDDLYGANETYGPNEQQVSQNALLGDVGIKGRNSSVDDFERKPSGEIASERFRQLGRFSESEAVKDRFGAGNASNSSTQSWDVTKSPAEMQSAQTDSQIATLVETYNDLMDKGEYNQAEVVAKQVQKLSPDSEMGSLLSNAARNKRREGEFGTFKSMKEEGFVDAVIDFDRSAIPTSDDNAYQFPKGWKDLSKRSIDAASDRIAGGDTLDGTRNQPGNGKLSDPPVATPMFDAPQAVGLEDKLADLQKSFEAPKPDADFGRSLIELKELEASERRLKLQDVPAAMPSIGEPPRVEVRHESEFARSKEKAAEPPTAGDSGKKNILEPKPGSNEPLAAIAGRMDVDSKVRIQDKNTALPTVEDNGSRTIVGLRAGATESNPLPFTSNLDVVFDNSNTIAATPFGGVASAPKPQPILEGRRERNADEFESRIQNKNPATPSEPRIINLNTIDSWRFKGAASVGQGESDINLGTILGRKSVSPQSTPSASENYWSFQGQAAGEATQLGRTDVFTTEGTAGSVKTPSKKNSLATGLATEKREELSLGEHGMRSDTSLMLSITPRIVVQEEEVEKLGKSVRPNVDFGVVPSDEAKQELTEHLKQQVAEANDYVEELKQAQPVPYFRFINPADQSGDSAAGLNLHMYRRNSNWFDNSISSEGLRGETGAVSANRGTVQLGGITRQREGKDVMRESLAPSPELASKSRDYKAVDSRKGYIEPQFKSTEAPKPAPASLVEESAKDNAFSTFSLHVSDVSFKLAASALAQQQLPEASSIRVEEFVNAMDYRDPLPNSDEKVACAIEQAIHPALMQRNLLRISMRTAALGRSKNTPLRLTILLDNSGSMERADRRQAIQRAFQTLTQQLTEKDQITLISFANSPRLLADKMSGGQGELLLQLVENMPSEGGTNIEAALRLAREKALEQKLDSAQNRIVLMTDGAVNLGDANPATLSKLVTELRDSGIAFDAAGICAQDLNDEVLEALTRQGDGRYYLLDTPQSIDAQFAAQIAGALRPTAQNVKVQVEFNPGRVGKFKLLGFEKHRLNQEDFRNDKVDAAELSASEAGVAVYQIEPLQNGSGDIGSVSVRFRDVATGRMIERRWPIAYEDNPARIDSASTTMKLAAAASLLAVKLKSDPLAQNVDLDELSKWVAKLPEPFSSHPRTQQLRSMIEQLRQISK
ncbi:MAG: von Willebrand factor type A domain-containing protein [Pirellulales bacterium]